MVSDEPVQEPTEETPYPYSVFPRNELRRVLGNLPAPHSQEVLDENWNYRSELWKDEPFDPAPYPTSRTLAELKERLDADPSSYVGARTQFTGQPFIGLVEGPNYTDLRIATILGELIEMGFAVENNDGSYSMTTEGYEALQA